MNTMEVLTLLLVVFAALSYIDNQKKHKHKKKRKMKNKKRYHPRPSKVKDAISFLAN